MTLTFVLTDRDKKRGQVMVSSLDAEVPPVEYLQ
jgi:hypothetical protein